MGDVRLSARGLSAFGSLRAEDEPWLAECFVPPTEFALMAEASSIIVFGPPGSGKSAIRRMLMARAVKPDGSPSHLIVEWQPNPAVWEPSVGFQSVPGQVAHIFDLCADALLHHLARNPDGWTAAPAWTHQMLTWFVQQFLRGDATVRAAHLLEGLPGSSVVADMIREEKGEALLPPGDWRLVAAEFSKSVKRLGLQGVWVFVDGVETWLGDRLEVGAFLNSLWHFLSTLPLFERSDFAYKVFLPSSLYTPLANAAGIDRSRFAPFRISWTESQLLQMARKRVALALGKEMAPEMLCEAPNFMETVRRTGGENPRVWLEVLRPVVAHYLEHGRPATLAEWKRLRRQVPLRLSVDEETGVVIAGGRVIPREALSAGAHRLLVYLYRNAGRVVPLDELYQRGYQKQSNSTDHYYDEGVLYSRLSELRKAIEPDPRDPLYLETFREKGVRLNVTW